MPSILTVFIYTTRMHVLTSNTTFIGRYWRWSTLFTSESESFNGRVTTQRTRLTLPCWRRCGTLWNRECAGRIGENSDFKMASGHNQIFGEWECLVSECDACVASCRVFADSSYYRRVTVHSYIYIPGTYFAFRLWVPLRTYPSTPLRCLYLTTSYSATSTTGQTSNG